MRVVSNTGPLIALAKMDLIAIVESLFTQVMIPAVVHEELLMNPEREDEIERIRAAVSRRILRVIDRQTPLMPPRPSEPAIALRALGPGESEAIRLALQLRGFVEFQSPLLLMDDKAGRRAADRLGLRVTGVIGILLHAKQDGHITEVGPLPQTMRENGYWLSGRAIREAMKLAGEVLP